MAIFVTACAPQVVKPTLTPVQKQQIQSRTYTGDVKRDDLFNAVLTVFQDKGYIIESANLATGIITGTSETQNNSTGWDTFAGVTKKARTKVTATVLKYGAGTRVRLNFLNTSEVKKETCNLYGMCNTSNDSDDTIVYDAQVYTSVFNAIDDALFVLGAGGTEVTN